jgi:hypothetical protein
MLPGLLVRRLGARVLANPCYSWLFVIEEQSMISLLIALSIVAFAFAVVYWSERVIFRQRPKDAAKHTISVALFEQTGIAAIILAGIVLMIALAIVIVPILCLLAFQRIVFGRITASGTRAISFLLRALSALEALFSRPPDFISRMRRRILRWKNRMQH